jgi:hypothetical protein
VNSESRAPKETDRMARPTDQLDHPGRLDPGETIPFNEAITRAPAGRADPGETIPLADGTARATTGRPDPGATIPITDHTARSVNGPTADPPPDPRRPTRSVRAGIAGILAAVLVILAIGMIVAQIVSARSHQPGPGALAVGAHVAGAIAGICCYRLTTRHRPVLATVLSFLALPLITGLLLWFFWWSPT